jgi:phage-related protein
MYGNALGMPHSKRLAPNLYELRIRGKEEIRILYIFSKQTIFLIHAFKKKTQKTPQKEILIAQQRMKELDSI